MPLLLRSLRRKPQHPVRVNLGHPMAKDIEAFFYHAGARGMWDAVAGSWAGYNAGSPRVAATPEGPAFYMPGDTKGVGLTVRNTKGAAGPQSTIIVRARLKSAQGGTIGALFSFANADNNPSNGVWVGVPASSSSLAWGICNNNGAALGGNTGTDDIGVARTIGISWTNGSAATDGWVDGAARGSTFVGGSVPTAAISKVFLGVDQANYRVCADIDVVWAVAFSRILTDAEHAWWHKNAFRVLENKSQSFGYALTQSPAATSGDGYQSTGFHPGAGPTNARFWQSPLSIDTGALATPSGVAGVGDVGTPTIALGTIAEPAGVAGVGNVGAPLVVASAVVAPAGVSGIGDVGTPVALVQTVAAPAGVSGVGTVGTPDALVQTVAAPAGVSGIGDVGTSTVSASALVQPAGVAGTGAVGTATVVASATVALDGVAGTGAVGTPLALVQTVVAPPGVAGVGAVGDVAFILGATVALDGVSGVGAVGTATVVASALAEPAGVAGAGVVGTPAVVTGAVVVLEGIAGNGEVGTPSVTTAGGVSAAPAGVAGIGDVGTPLVVASAVVAPAGVSGIGDVGAPVALVQTVVPLTGVSGTGAVGTPTDGGVLVGLDGVAGVGAVGTPAISASATVALSGVSGAGAITNPIAITAIVNGVAGVGAVGSIIIVQGAIVQLVGVSGFGLAGTSLLDVFLFGQFATFSGTEGADQWLIEEAPDASLPNESIESPAFAVTEAADDWGNEENLAGALIVDERAVVDVIAEEQV